MLIRRAVILVCFIFATGAAFAQIVQNDAGVRSEDVTRQQLQALSIVTTCGEKCTDWQNGR